MYISFLLCIESVVFIKIKMRLRNYLSSLVYNDVTNTAAFFLIYFMYILKFNQSALLFVKLSIRLIFEGL